MSKNFGFSLAEIMVTLGLIGVISAMTIPNLAYNYRAKVIEQQFRATYSDIMQISNMISRSNGDIGVYANKLGGSEWARTFMANVTGGGSLDASAMSEHSGSNQSVDEVLNEFYRNAGSPPGPYAFYPRKAVNHICNDNGVWIDAKGRLWTFNEKNRIVCVDVNGSAAPNRYDIDTFAFIPMRSAQVGEWVYDDTEHPNSYTGQLVLCDIDYLYTSGTSDNEPRGAFAKKGKGSALDACPFNEPLENIAPLQRKSDGSYKTFGVSAIGKKTSLKDTYWNTYIHYK